MTPGSTASLGSSLLPLVLLVGVLLAVRWWQRRGRHATARPLVKVTSRAGLTKGAVVALVTVEDRRLLVGASEHGVQLLTELEPAAEDATRTTHDTTPSTHDDAATEVMVPGRAFARRDPASPHGRPRMGLVHRLQEMTLRQAGPPRAHPWRPSGDPLRR